MKITEPIAYSLRTIGKHPRRILTMTALSYLLLFFDPAIQLILKKRSEVGWGPYFTIPGMAVFILMSLALINFFSACYRGETTTLRDDIVRIRGAFWSTVFSVLAVSSLVLFGAFLFALPALWVSTVLSLAWVAPMINRDADKNPLRLSYALVKGNFWPMFGLFIVFSIPRFSEYATDRLPFPHQLRLMSNLFLSMCLLPVVIGSYVGSFHLLWDEKVAQGGPPAPGGARLEGLPAFLGSLGLVLVLLVQLVGLSFAARFVTRLNALRPAMARAFPQERAILGFGHELDVPDNWTLLQPGPFELRVIPSDAAYVKEIIVTASEAEYLPAPFRGRMMDAAFFKEYVSEGLLRGIAGDRVGTFVTQESWTSGDRTWTVLAYQTAERAPRVLVYYLTNVGADRFICATFAHSLEIKEKGALIAEVKRVKDMLATLRDTGKIPFWNLSDELDPLIRPGDRLLLTPLAAGEEPKVGDLVVYRTRSNKKEWYALRVARAPGDTYRDANDEEHQVPPRMYFLLADNPYTDQHTRYIGPVDLPRIIGKVTEIYGPRKRRRTLDPSEGKPIQKSEE